MGFLLFLAGGATPSPPSAFLQSGGGEPWNEYHGYFDLPDEEDELASDLFERHVSFDAFARRAKYFRDAEEFRATARKAHARDIEKLAVQKFIRTTIVVGGVTYVVYRALMFFL
jgi:hypothetical protein